MTKEMVHIIIKVALERLLQDSNDELSVRVAWLTKDKVKWCLSNYREALQDDESIRAFMKRAVELLESIRC